MMTDEKLKQEQADEEMINQAFQHLLDSYLTSKHRRKVEIITKAFNFAKQAHKGVKRRSGEPYIMHPIAVAQIACSEIGLGSTSICAALLHDVVEDTDFTMEDSPCWSLLLHGCESAVISDLKIVNPFNHANTDGIDVDTCLNVCISDCFIDTGDDAIAIRCNGKKLKSGRTICENIRVDRCKLASSACGIRVGVGRGKIRDVKCKNLTITRAGSAIELMTAYRKNGDANLYDLRFESVYAANVSYPFRFLQWNESEISDVIISDFQAQCYCSAAFESETYGKIQNVAIRNFSMEILDAPFVLDERAPSERGEYAFSAQGVSGLALENINVLIAEQCKGDWKGFSRFEDCKNVSKKNCNF